MAGWGGSDVVKQPERWSGGKRRNDARPTRLTYLAGHRMFTGLFVQRDPGEVAESAEGTRLLSE